MLTNHNQNHLHRRRRRILLPSPISVPSDTNRVANFRLNLHIVVNWASAAAAAEPKFRHEDNSGR